MTNLNCIQRGEVHSWMSFTEKVWALTSRVPEGWVTTYRDIARALNTRAYRAVGQALHRNPHAPTVPCHRVVASSGHLNGYAKGLNQKARRLRAEGVAVHGQAVNLKHYHWTFDHVAHGSLSATEK
jgi:methylated-DNA-[protein]-cysteine S-methyltransferase